MTDEEIRARACTFVKEHSREIIDKIAGDAKYASSDIPISLFMAGSPGAGKTELSKTLVEILENRAPIKSVVRIDIDEIREFFHDYSGKNSSLFQYAASVAVDKIHDYVLK